MAMGPVQVLVVGFGPDAEFKGEALDQLRLLREQDIVRVIDLLVVHHREDGTVEKLEIADHEELAEFGAIAGALIGFGAAGEEGAEVGAEAGAELGDADELYDDAEVWCIADSIPAGMTAAIVILEHRWAIPLRNAIANAGGVALSDKWLHPQDLLAVGAAFGILTAVFQWGWGLELIGLANPYGTVPIASYVPLLMFAVLFGMSTDYEVFLISQIFQAHGSGEGPSQAVRTGVGTSARVITAAAVIMVTVFLSFLLNPDPVIKEFGVGLSVAIILDTTIVRLVIVPSTMVLLGEWNWYLPRWLQWLPHADLREDVPVAAEASDAAAAQPAHPEAAD